MFVSFFLNDNWDNFDNFYYIVINSRHPYKKIKLS